MNPFQSLSEYERFIYTLQQRYASISQSTLTLARRGRGFAVLTGELIFSDRFRLVAYEILTWDEGDLTIRRYGYEIWSGSVKLFWYDPQPHPDDLALASTHPHHKHIPPDVKHNRIPAPGFRFDGPNLPLLIEEIEAMLAG